MAAPVAINLAGAMANIGGGGVLSSSPPAGGGGGAAPRSPTSPVLSPAGGFAIRTPSPYVNLNVRETFETYGLDQTKEISKRINLEIEKKREELRTLVGERYRDLIDAADTIRLMSSSSANIFQRLGALRLRMSTLPSQLNSGSLSSLGSSTTSQSSKETLTNDELEIAFEIKLSLDATRVAQQYVDEKRMISATHLCLLVQKSLCQRPYYKRMFLSSSNASGSGDDDSDSTSSCISNSILNTCDNMMGDFSISPELLAECVACKQVLTNSSCCDIITQLLAKRIQLSEQIITSGTTTDTKEFIDSVACTLHAIYVIFIDGQLYNNAAKEMRRPKVSLSSFGLKRIPKVVELFTNESIKIEDTPRAAQLAQLLVTAYVDPLKSLLVKSFNQNQYLQKQQSFRELNEYQTETVNVLKQQTEDLMRIVLGTSKSLWVEVFYPIFQQKSERVAENKICSIFNFLREEAVVSRQKLDDEFDLVSYIWKTNALKIQNSTIKSASFKTTATSHDVDMKLKCISPQIADTCTELEDKLLQFSRDFQTLGDHTLKHHISSKILEEWKRFVDEALDNNLASLFLGRFVTSTLDLCPTLWKLMDVKDATSLRSLIDSVSEDCWTRWSTNTGEKFTSNLRTNMQNVNQNFQVAVFMPAAEVLSDENVMPSIRVPIQISHNLHSNLYTLCHDLCRVGPQSIPKKVREKLRRMVGINVIALYQQQFVDGLAENPVLPQVAIQLIFDIKFCQWFHLEIKEKADPLIKSLQNSIDPFDMDIVSPKLKSNLKRFLFETHLTLGLLFSEESHSFIAQNFKTKMNVGFPVSNPSISSPLPLLPV